MTTFSPYPDVAIPNTDLWSFLFQRHRDFPDTQTLLTDASTGRSYTFADARKLGLHFGRCLQQQWNWQKGDVMTVFSSNAIDLPPIIWGAIAVGGVVSPLNPAFSAKDLAHYLKDSKSRAVVTQRAQYPVVVEAAQKAGLDASRIIVIDGPSPVLWQSNAALIPDGEYSTPHRPPITDPKKDLVFLVYSSGTTGLPKGVMLSHTNIVANLIQSAAVDDGVLTHQDRTLACLPFFHIYGLTYLVNYGAFMGMSTYIMPRFNLEQFCQTIQKHRITYAYTVPPVILQLLENPKAIQYDLSSIRMFKCSAAPLSRQLIQSLKTKFSIDVRQAYGMSECSPCTHLQTWQEAREHPGVAGRLIPNMVAKYVPIEGEKKTTNAPTEGELWVKGPNVFLGYFNNPTATAESFSPDGFYKTGDVGYEDPNGHFVITDRVKELIKYNGFQVPPAELEGILLGHPAVADVAVVGIPVGQAGSELPRAYVRTRAREQAHEQTGRDIQQFVKERVASYKQLRGGVVFVEAIPRNPSGKILRRELRRGNSSKI
ncbi:hypothetical protein FE257_009738 [Aspergillus nanangensis]|uniref:Acetyl-CoA synthetase-like protein n=1 Tax=Aspergillus nanangensis TaxID=2582783 RepID=A0AAD4CJH7_ASPNN|nr:hypothetical protein FE257_009738 [Aspergillus nanangensis]